MNKKVSLVIIQKPDLPISSKNLLLTKEGKVINYSDGISEGSVPIEYYFVDDRPIRPFNEYIYYDNGTKKKTCTEIDFVLSEGIFKKGERKIYLNQNQVMWYFESQTKKYEKFGLEHINSIIDRGFTCFVKEKDNECNGDTCLNCDCYEYDENKFKPEIIQEHFVIVF